MTILTQDFIQGREGGSFPTKRMQIKLNHN